MGGGAAVCWVQQVGGIQLSWADGDGDAAMDGAKAGQTGDGASAAVMQLVAAVGQGLVGRDSGGS